MIIVNLNDMSIYFLFTASPVTASYFIMKEQSNPSLMNEIPNQQKKTSKLRTG